MNTTYGKGLAGRTGLEDWRARSEVAFTSVQLVLLRWGVMSIPLDVLMAIDDIALAVIALA